MLQFARKDPQYRSILLDFRASMFQSLTVITALFSALTGYAILLLRPVPYTLFFMAFGFSACALIFRQMAKRYPNGARYAFVISLYAGLFAEMLILPDASLPFMIFPILLISALLMSNTTLLAALIFFAFTALLNLVGWAEYRLDLLALLLGFMVAVTNTTVGTFNIALEWYSSMHKRADELLNDARERRAELVQTLKSLEIAYDTQQRLQQQLLYARNQAEEARRTKERFAANISHELRTPLNLILGFSEIMYLTPEVYGLQAFPPTLQRDISQIHRSSKHLLAMIDDVLDLSHIDASQFSLNFEHTATSVFLDETADMLANLFNGRPVTFQRRIEAGLPYLEIDRTRIRQVLINLVTNAQRFTTAGSVTLSAWRNHSEVVISVADTGAGIAPDKLELIFDEFYQVDYSLSRKHGGAGLGLAITRRFVEAHNGSISVQSIEGAGSTFLVSLPIPQSRRSDPRHAERSYEHLEKNLEPVVLFAEQDARIVSLLARHLPDHKVVAIDSHEQISAAIQRYSPRALVVNRSPGGLQALPPCSVPVIECSLPSTTWMVNQLRVAACLAKPVRPQDIIDQLNRYPHARTILVVDDDLGFVQLVQRTIEASGRRPCTILRAYDGQQALETLRSNPPDLLLLDLAMPETSGFDVLEIIQMQKLDHIPVILLSGTQYTEHEEEMLSELIVRQPRGLRPMEAVKAIRALVHTLEPR